MAEQRFQVGRMNNLKAGTKTWPDVNVPTGWTSVEIEVSRENWPDGGDATMTVKIDLSLDNGATWIENYLGFTAAGGAVVDRDGNESFISSAKRDIPEPLNPNKKARATVTNSERLSSTVTIILRDV